MTLRFTEKLGDIDLEFYSNPAAEVFFVDGMMDPLGSIALVTKGYKGIYEDEDVTEDEINSAFKDLNSTQLKTPFEMMAFTFLIKHVTRSFTHQLVRTRVGASFVQESMRFTGHKGVYRFLIGATIFEHHVERKYVDSCMESINEYEEMMKTGVSSEDARGVLPHGIMTSAFVGYTLSTLEHVYSQRMCCQAQPGEWQVVMRQMKNTLIEHYGNDASKLLSAPYERGESCGYRASFDRSCVWQKSN